MKTEYERTLNHAWMILESDQVYEEDYQMRMLLANVIPGLLSVRGQGTDEKSRYRYEISGKISMKAQGEKKPWGSRQIEAFMRQLIQVLYELTNHLLDANRLNLNPNHIYCQNEQFHFCYCPAYAGNIRDEFHALTEYFVREADYGDKEGIYLAYELHKASMDENYNIEQALEQILERKEKAMEKVEVQRKMESYELEEDIILDDWAGEQEMGSSVLRDRQTVWGFVNQRIKKRQSRHWDNWEETDPEG